MTNEPIVRLILDGTVVDVRLDRKATAISCHDVPGCLALGLRHGGYCVGCCWVLMALLFVGGVMNVLWIARRLVRIA